MPRRLFAVAVAGAVSLVALAGCRIENPSDAAYVGNTRHTQADINRIVDSVTADGAKVADSQKPALRQRILGDLVFVDIAKRYSAEKGYPDPKVDTATEAANVGLPASDPFVQLEAQVQGYQSLLKENIPPAKLADADFHDVYALLLSQQAVQPGTEPNVTQQLKQQFAADLAAAVALRNELGGAMKRYGTSINPKLLPTAYPLLLAGTANGGSVVLVQLPLGGSASAAPVRDLPTPDATFVPESAQ